MRKDTMLIQDKETGMKFECFLQSIDLNGDGRYVMRYNIGINGYHEWTNVCCVYSNDEFNKHYQVLKERAREF